MSQSARGLLAPCSTCGKAFQRKGDYNRHLRIHDKTTWTACPYPRCNHSTAQKANLDGHINKKHLAATPHRCRKSGCHLAFADRSDRARHEKNCPRDQASGHLPRSIPDNLAPCYDFVDNRESNTLSPVSEKSPLYSHTQNDSIPHQLPQCHGMIWTCGEEMYHAASLPFWDAATPPAMQEYSHSVFAPLQPTYDFSSCEEISFPNAAFAYHPTTVHTPNTYPRPAQAYSPLANSRTADTHNHSNHALLLPSYHCNARL